MGTPVASPVYTLAESGWQGNVIDEDGCLWVVEDEDGWSDGPSVAAVVEDRESGDGAWTGPGQFKARVITLSGKCLAPSQVEMLRAKDRLIAAASPHDPADLIVEEVHLTRKAQVRLTDKPQATDKGTLAFSWSLTLTAGDPRRYAAVPIQVSTLLGGIDGGRRYTRDYPRTYPEGDTSQGRVTINHNGTYRTCPAVITINGPVIGPQIVHMQTGRRLQFDLTLSYDETLVIDLGTGTALLNGNASRTGALAVGSAWFQLAKGENTLRFRGEPGPAPAGMTPPPVASMEVVASPAWV